MYYAFAYQLISNVLAIHAQNIWFIQYNIFNNNNNIVRVNVYLSSEYIML